MHVKFLVVSNGRCGSTWMLTSLAQIPGVFADYEFKWRPDYHLHPIHRKFTGPDHTCHDVLAAEGCRGKAVGSKITMDPWLTGRRPSNQEKLLDFFKMDLADFIGSVPQDVFVIHIVRDYWSIFKSGFGRGYVHKVNLSNANPGTAQVTAQAVHALSNHEFTPQPIDIDGNKAKNILASLVLNDIYINGLRNRGDRYIRISYDDISLRFKEICKVVAPWIDWQNQENYSVNSFTEKLPHLEDSIVNINNMDKYAFYEAYHWAMQLDGGQSNIESYFQDFFMPLLESAQD